MLIYILENYYHDAKLRNILNTHMAETLLLGGSLCIWVEKINRTMTWGDFELIHVISYMLKLKISILDFGGGTSNIATWYIGRQKSIKEAHVVLLHNGSTHFTGMGNILYWAYVTLFALHSTVIIKPYQTPSNHIKHFALH